MVEDKDRLYRFLFTEAGVRGVWVHLNETYRKATEWQTLSAEAIEQLGLGLAAVGLLSATIKIQGSVFIQAKAEAWVESLLLQANNRRQLRGMIRTREQPPTLDLGHGQLILTLEPDQGQTYQGVVDLAGQPLSAALEAYFRESEQLPTRIWLAADGNNAAGLLLQQMPGEQKAVDDWPRLTLLADTISIEELIHLSNETLLNRLFHQEVWSLYPGEPLAHFCTCSEEKTLASLQAMAASELVDICAELGFVEVSCQFCGRRYQHQPEKLQALGLIKEV